MKYGFRVTYVLPDDKQRKSKPPKGYVNLKDLEPLRAQIEEIFTHGFTITGIADHTIETFFGASYLVAFQSHVEEGLMSVLLASKTKKGLAELTKRLEIPFIEPMSTRPKIE